MRINKFIWTILLVIITAVFVFLFVMPKYHEFTVLEAELAQKQVDYNTKSAYYGNISELLKKIDTNKGEFATINSALPSDFYLSSSVYFFQNKAVQNNLVVKSIALAQMSVPTKDNLIKDIVFNVHLTGSYEGFKNFLASLDNSARLFEINSISFNTAAIEEKKDNPKVKNSTYDFTMEILMHSY